MIGLPPGTTRHVLRADLNAAGARNVRGDGFAQFGQSLGGAVVGPALVERLLGGFDDVRRGREIGLADFQVDHALALASSARARTRTSKADSTPMRDILSASFIVSTFLNIPA